MSSEVERWSQRFRARVDAVAAAAARPGTPEEQHARELHLLASLAWLSGAFVVLFLLLALLSDGPWWLPVGMALCAASFVRSHRRARRRGGPPLIPW